MLEKAFSQFFSSFENLWGRQLTAVICIVFQGKLRKMILMRCQPHSTVPQALSLAILLPITDSEPPNAF